MLYSSVRPDNNYTERIDSFVPGCLAFEIVVFVRTYDNIGS